MKINPSDILNFWFKELSPKQWWQKDLTFDAMIQERFLAIHKEAKLNTLFSWRSTAQGRLAEIIILDQFSRNIYRDKPESFASDPQALALSQEAVLNQIPEQLDKEKNAFLLMPYMHSESLKVHEQAVVLFAKYAPDNLEFENKHKKIIERFGRYPHRNSILGRQSSEQEISFLKEPNSSF